MSSSSIKVWDLFIRFFHWTLVVAFLTSYLTEGETNLHFYSGWYIVMLLSLRVIWGFFGTKYARFTDFIQPPSGILKYARKLIFKQQGFDKKHIGHNPLGGLMVIVLILALTLNCISGVMLYTSEGKSLFAFVGQPLFNEHEEHEEHLIESSANHKDEETDQDGGENRSEKFWENTHELLANLTLFLILLHIAGVIVSSRLQSENLVKAMICGRKKIEKE
jgi:cytochrome b